MYLQILNYLLIIEFAHSIINPSILLSKFIKININIIKKINKNL